MTSYDQSHSAKKKNSYDQSHIIFLTHQSQLTATIPSPTDWWIHTCHAMQGRANASQNSAQEYGSFNKFWSSGSLKPLNKSHQFMLQNWWVHLSDILSSTTKMKSMKSLWKANRRNFYTQNCINKLHMATCTRNHCNICHMRFRPAKMFINLKCKTPISLKLTTMKCVLYMSILYPSHAIKTLSQWCWHLPSPNQKV